MISLYLEDLLQKLGCSEMTALYYANKYVNFKSWLFRKHIHIAHVGLPIDDMPKNEYVKVSASIDDMKITSVSGLWRKTYVWSAMAKVNKESICKIP